jgi:hypothetical protein
MLFEELRSRGDAIFVHLLKLIKEVLLSSSGS